VSKRLSFLTIAALCGHQALCASQGAAAQEQHMLVTSDSNYVTIRATSAVPDAVIEYVARQSEPTSLEIPANESPHDFIRGYCGAYTKRFGEIFKEFNPKFELAPAAQPRIVSMPACIKWQKTHVRGGRVLDGVPVKVLPDEGLEDVLMRASGVKSEDRLACQRGETSPRCNKTFRELVQQLNPRKDLNRLEAGEELLLPFVSVPTSFRVSAKSGLTVQQVVDGINERLKQTMAVDSVTEVRAGPAIRLLSAISPQKVSERPCLSPAKPWPYDPVLVSDAIKRTRAAMESRKGKRSPKRVVITVIDSGLDTKLAPEFPSQFLWFDANDHHGSGAYRERTEPLQTDDKDGARWHGTYVARIATGAPSLREALSAAKLDLAELLAVNVYNLYQPQPNGYGITETGVQDGIAYALNNEAKVANISIGSESPIQAVLDKLAINKILLVVAAGNDKWDLGGERKLYPAFYGGSHEEGGTKIITVGAHDGDGGLARDFSNYSKEAVDVLAPGCAVPGANTAGAAHYGTSFAAPIVSMTAALVSAFWWGEPEPKAIKRRLRAAVDYDPKLSKIVAWSGRLNIAKSIALYHDVLEWRRKPGANPELVYGTWVPPAGSKIKLCADEEEELPVEWIKKISLVSSSPLRIRYLYFNGNKLVETGPCIPARNWLTFAQVENDGVGEAFNVRWEDFVDLVRHEFKLDNMAKAPAELDNNEPIARVSTTRSSAEITPIAKTPADRENTLVRASRQAPRT
jgi:subtilisin family serine protease